MRLAMLSFSKLPSREERYLLASRRRSPVSGGRRLRAVASGHRHTPSSASTASDAVNDGACPLRAARCRRTAVVAESGQWHRSTFYTVCQRDSCRCIQLRRRYPVALWRRQQRFQGDSDCCSFGCELLAQL